MKRLPRVELARGLAVERFSDEGVAEVGEVEADLVLATGLETDLDPGEGRCGCPIGRQLGRGDRAKQVGECVAG